MTAPRRSSHTVTGTAVLRRAVGDDQGWVASSWCWDSREDGKQVDRVLDRKDVRVTVATPATRPNHILGWVAFEHQPRFTIVHMVHVRGQYRRQGIGRRLWLAAIADRSVPVVVTSNWVPKWADGMKAFTKMTLKELLNP